MIDVFISGKSSFKFDKKLLKARVKKFLEKKGIKEAEIGITIVGNRMMKNLNLKFRGINETTPVLTFPLEDPKAKYKFVDPPDRVLRLGDIVISYPEVILLAREENKLVDKKIEELVEHGLKKLLEVTF